MRHYFRYQLQLPRSTAIHVFRGRDCNLSALGVFCKTSESRKAEWGWSELQWSVKNIVIVLTVCFGGSRGTGSLVSAQHWTSALLGNFIWSIILHRQVMCPYLSSLPDFSSFFPLTIVPFSVKHPLPVFEGLFLPPFSRVVQVAHLKISKEIQRIFKNVCIWRASRKVLKTNNILWARKNDAIYCWIFHFFLSSLR